MKRMSIDEVDLLEELIREILLRLSVKALLRFKCVCKQWCALIRSKNFIDGHFDLDCNRGCLVFERHSYPYREISMHTVYTDDERYLRFDMFSIITRDCELLRPANGIFCVVNVVSKHLFLFNPATRKLKLLPPIPLPEWINLILGFGFDPISGDYKVVAFDAVEWESRKFLCLYNSSSDSWRKTELVDWLNKRINILDCGNCRSKAALINGVYYWLMNDISIIGFDMRSENFHEIPTPDTASLGSSNAITAYGDSVALLSYGYEVGNRVDFWVMGRDGLWTQNFSIAIDLPQPITFMWRLCGLKKNELLIETLNRERKILRCSYSLFKCDISTQKVLKVEQEFDHFYIWRVFSYKESFFSIEGERDIPDFSQDIFQLGEGDD